MDTTDEFALIRSFEPLRSMLDQPDITHNIPRAPPQLSQLMFENGRAALA